MRTHFILAVAFSLFLNPQTVASAQSTAARAQSAPVKSRTYLNLSLKFILHLSLKRQATTNGITFPSWWLQFLFNSHCTTYLHLLSSPISAGPPIRRLLLTLFFLTSSLPPTY